MAEMPYDELKKWAIFFRERPPGYREDQRTLMLMKTFGYKGKGTELFATLKQIEDNQEARKNAGQALPTGKFLDMMMKATNGDNSGWKPEWGGKRG